MNEHNPERAERHLKAADLKVPPHIHRLAHYFHSLTEIYEYYRGFGTNMPRAFQAELARAEAELVAVLEEEANQGGALHHYYSEILRKEQP
jgi:hypothetical protein